MNYLIIEGYKDVAQAFQEEAGVKSMSFSLLFLYHIPMAFMFGFWLSA